MDSLEVVSIPLVARITTTPNGYTKLVDIYYRCKDHYNIEISLHFYELEWIDANMAGLLHAILYKLNKENGLTFAIDVEYVKTKFEILFRNGFLKELLSIPDNSGTTVQLTTFNKDEDEKFVNFIEKDLLGNEGMKIRDISKEKMTDHFLEVFTNVQIHARTEDPIFGCGQFFPKTKQLVFTLVDLGIGYLPPIEKHTKGKITTAEQAINWAISGNSTKEDAPGGIGLKHLLAYCTQTASEFNIITGDAYWGNNLGEIGTRAVKPFCGTIVHLLFNCK